MFHDPCHESEGAPTEVRALNRQLLAALFFVLALADQCPSKSGWLAADRSRHCL